MPKRLVSFLVLSLLAIATPAGADMSKQELQDMYISYLNEKGRACTVDSDGDIFFSYTIQEMPLNFYIIVYEDDPQCFHIAAVDYWPINSQRELEQAFIATSVVSYNNWVVKAYVTAMENSVNFSAEMLLAKPQDFINVFDSMMSFMEQGMIDFTTQIEKALP